MGLASGELQFIILITIVNLYILNAFNLETRLPLVKKGPKNSYFGYSVAEHLIVNEMTKKTTESV